jgi:hypothetical protein
MLGHASSSGSQNDVRYAFFADYPLISGGSLRLMISAHFDDHDAKYAGPDQSSFQRARHLSGPRGSRRGAGRSLSDRDEVLIAQEKTATQLQAANARIADLEKEIERLSAMQSPDTTE